MWILLIPLAAILLYFFGVPKRPKNFPPGPPGLPIVGNVFQVGLEHYKWAMRMEKKYGDIIGFRLGSQWIVYLNNPNDIREAFSMPEFSGRPGFNYLADRRVEDFNYGIILSTGSKWVDHRRFTLQTLRDFGFAKRSSENMILEDVRETIQGFKRRAGQPFDSHSAFNVAVFNVIWSLISSTRYSHDDPEAKELIHLFDVIESLPHPWSLLAKGFVVTMIICVVHAVTSFLKAQFRGLRPLLFLFPELINLCKNIKFIVGVEAAAFRAKMSTFMGNIVQSHRETFKKGEPRDFIDAILEENIRVPGTFDDVDIETILCDFFIGGSETTSTALTWTVYLMALYPDIQEKLFQEITREVGHQEVTLSDRSKLVYVEAVTQEILRVASLAPAGTFHATTKDIMYKGYFFPKNTTVLPNIYASLWSKDIWGDPENFRPERFLEKDEKSAMRQKALIPFGVGKRFCLGRSLAKDEFFLFFTNLILKLKFSFPPNEPPHNIFGETHGTIRVCGDHSLLVECRE